LPACDEVSTQRGMSEKFPTQRKNPGWSSTLKRAILISAGCLALLLPAWLPNRPSVPIERGTVEMLQALLLAASAVVMLGASPHAGRYRPMCRMLALGCVAAVVGEIEDFVSGILGWPFPESWLVGGILIVALGIALKHRRTTIDFFSRIGSHAGTGLIVAALLINYIFNILMGSETFWQVALGDAFSPVVPKICKSYLELLACYLIFIGAFGLSLTMARRQEPR